jgi:hypothetical protein
LGVHPDDTLRPCPATTPVIAVPAVDGRLQRREPHAGGLARSGLTGSIIRFTK